MYSFTINNVNFECPQGLEEVPVIRMDKYFKEVFPLQPAPIGRKGIMGRFFDWLFRRKHDPELVKRWKEYNRIEVGFWLQIPKGLLALVSEEDIAAIHNLLKFDPPKDKAQKFTYKETEFRVDYLISDLPEGDSLTEMLSATVKDSQGRTRPPSFWNQLPADQAIRVCNLVGDQQKTASMIMGGLITDKVFYKRDKFTKIAEHAH